MCGNGHSSIPSWARRPSRCNPACPSDYFESERERIFRRVWLNVAREDEIPAPGDYIVCDIEMVGCSILVVRGRDGRVRAFHNVCSHRGNKVATDARGQCRAFVCGFHGWAYDLQGGLAHVPDEEQFFGLDKAACGLKAVAADVWEGFVFINLSPEPAQPLGEFIGEWGAALRGYPFDAMALRHRYQAHIKVNWKIALDAFQEAWHARFVHKRSGGAAYASQENPYIHALEFKLYPLHRMMSVPGNPQFTPTPLQGVAHRFGSFLHQDGGLRDTLAQGRQSATQPPVDVRFELRVSELLPVPVRGHVFHLSLLACGGGSDPVGNEDLLPAAGECGRNGSARSTPSARSAIPGSRI